MFESLLLASVFVGIYMICMWLIGTLKKDNSIVDVAWGMGYIGIATLLFVRAGLYVPRHIIIYVLVLIWGLRLSGYILLRNWGKGEDIRYREMRAKWGNAVVWRSLVQIYILQGIIMLIVALPIIAILSSVDASIYWTDITGIIIFIIGFVFESIGDYQLRCFRQNPANHEKVMDQGLWYYTRHPNYFGESVMWWAIWLIALVVPYGLFTIISPLVMTYLLRYVSGVPLTEKYFVGNPAYEAYKKRTSPLIPWFVK